MLSVKKINEKCDEILKESDRDYDRTDVIYYAAKLRDAMNVMNAEYAKDAGYDEKQVQFKKDECEKAAIRLEYAISHLNREYRHRYAERMEAVNAFTFVHDALRKNIQTIDKNAFTTVLIGYETVAGIASRAEHLDFELTEEDRDTIEVIKKDCERLMEV